MAASRNSAIRRTGQVFTGLGALIVLFGVLVGAPIALTALAGNPLPDHVPTLTEISTALTSRDDGQLFLRALALAGWFGWATFAFSVLVELGAQLLRRPAPRLPGLRQQQRAAAALVGSVAMIIAVSPAATAATSYAAGPYPGHATALAAPVAQSTTMPPAQPTAAEPAAAPAYRVAKGDYLGKVAERYLDDFDRYQELARINKIRNPDQIRPGQIVRLPSEATDGGVRRHAGGRIVVRQPAPSRPAPAAPPAAAEPAPPQPTPAASTPAQATPARPTPAQATPDRPSQSAPAQPPAAEAPAEQPATVTVGAARATGEDRVNRPLAVSAVLAVASIIGAQIGAVLGLRRRPGAPGTSVAARASAVLPFGGRHRKG